MIWRTGIAMALTTVLLTTPVAAQAKDPAQTKDSAQKDSVQAKESAQPQPRQPDGDTGSGNRPPGTPSWGDKGSSITHNPTAPCPAGTSRLNLGEDCHPLDQESKKPNK